MRPTTIRWASPRRSTRNLLVRINRELGADFDSTASRIARVWNPRAPAHRDAPGEPRAAARATSRRAASSSTSHAGETIWTESSYKYDAAAFANTLWQAGFSPVASWQDEAAGFLLTLAASR